jgi:hypothetical protein
MRLRAGKGVDISQFSAIQDFNGAHSIAAIFLGNPEQSSTGRLSFAEPGELSDC